MTCSRRRPIWVLTTIAGTAGLWACNGILGNRQGELDPAIGVQDASVDASSESADSSSDTAAIDSSFPDASSDSADSTPDADTTSIDSSFPDVDASSDSADSTPDADAAAIDSSVADADAGDVASDSAFDADSDSGTTVTWSALSDKNAWSFKDMNSYLGGCPGYLGGVFDGRYVYYAPGESSSLILLRFDTQGVFEDSISWRKLDLAPIAPMGLKVSGFGGMIKAKTFIYLVPRSAGEPVLRFDTAKPFVTESFEAGPVLTPSGSTGNGYMGGVFDGTHIYFSPLGAWAARFKITDIFKDPDSWELVNLELMGQKAGPYRGMVSAGNYVYFSPGSSSNVIRYDSTHPFNDAVSWESHASSGNDFFGVVRDNSSVFFVPSSTTSANLLSYNTAQPWNNATAWPSSSLTQNNAAWLGFRGGAWDGRHVYLVQHDLSSSQLGGLVIRRDEKGVWESLNAIYLSANAKGFSGAVFDGKRIYLVPGAQCVFARFTARDDTMALPEWYSGGSFL